MIDIQTVIDYLTLNTPYRVEAAKDTLPNYQDIVDLPVVYVGYATIDSKNPKAPIEHSLFNTNGEDLVQGFEIHIVCQIANFSAIWVTLYKVLIGWNPEFTEKYHSGFTYAQGGKMGLSNSKFWHVDIWKIGFPTNLKL